MKTNHRSKLLVRVIAVLIIFSMVLPWNSLLAVGVENRGAEGITVHQDGAAVVIAANGNPIIVQAISSWYVKIYEDNAPLGVLGQEDTHISLVGKPGVKPGENGSFELPSDAAVVGGSFNKPYSGETKVTMVGDNYQQALHLSLVGGGYTSTTATTNADVSGNTDVTISITGSGPNISVYGGGFAKVASANIKGNTKVTLENGKIGNYANRICGGGYATGGNANVAGNTQTFINGGGSNSTEVYGGGYGTVGKCSANVSGSTGITVSGNSTIKKIYGGGYNAGITSADTGESKIQVNSGQIADIYGGGCSGSDRKALVTGNTNIEINGGIITGKVGGGGSAGAMATSDVQGKASIIIKGGTFNYSSLYWPNVFGGGSASGGGTATVGSSSIEIFGGDFSKSTYDAPIICGGGIEGNSQVLGDSYVYIAKGKFQRSIAAGGFPNASANTQVFGNTTVEIVDGKIPKLINGKIGAAGTETLKTLYISGGTILDNATGAEAKLSAADPQPVYRTAVQLKTLGGENETQKSITSILVDGKPYGSYEFSSDNEGKIYMYLPEGTNEIKVTTSEGKEYKGTVTTDSSGTASGSLYFGEYKSITDLLLKSKTAYTWKSLKLRTSISPDDATFRTIVWRITDDGGTKAALAVDVLSAEESGTVTLTATVDKGTSLDQPFTKDFTINVIKEANPLVSGGVSFDTNRILANGNPILIKEGTKGLNVYYDFGELGKLDDKDMWIDLNQISGFTQQDGVDEETGFTFETTPSVYGGGKDLNVSATSVTLLSGKISALYGGGFVDTDNKTAKVSGDVQVKVYGGTIGTIYGGGSAQANYGTIASKEASVEGAIDIKIFDGTITNVYGGGDSYNDSFARNYNASVNDTAITLYGGAIKDVYGGGKGNGNGSKAMVSGTATICVEGGNYSDTNISLGGNATEGEKGVADVNMGTMIIKGGYLGGMIDMAALNGWVTGNTVLDIRGGTISGSISESKRPSKDRKLYISGGSITAKTNFDAYAPFLSNGAVRSADDSTPVYGTGITLKDGIDVKVDQLTQDAGKEYGLNDVRTDSNGKISVYLPTGTKTTAAKAGEKLYQNKAGVLAGKSGTLSAFVPVTDITGVENLIISSGVETTIPATVSPSNATIQEILWSVKDTGSAEVSVKDNKLIAASVGTAILEAKVPGGLGSLDFVKDVLVTAKAKVLGFIQPEPVLGVYSGAPKTEEGLGLPKKIFATTEGSDIKVPVTWDVEQCSYDPDKKEYQEFTVSGKVNLDYILNSSELSPDVTIKVETLSPPLKDDVSGITVGGKITADAKLVVTDIGEDNPAYQKLLKELGDGGQVLSAYELGIKDGSITGDAQITFPIDEQYNGKAIEILQQSSDGTIKGYTQIVKDGFVTIRAKELTTFLIGISGEEKIVVSDETELRKAVIDVGAKDATIMLNGNISITSSGKDEDTLKIPADSNITLTDDGNPRELSIYRPDASQCAVSVELGGELKFASSGDKTLTLRIGADAAVPGDTGRHTINNMGKLSFSGVNLLIEDKSHHSVRSTGQLFISNSDVTGIDAREYYQYNGGAFSLMGDTSRTEVDQSTFSGFASGPAISASEIDSLKLNQTTMSDCGHVKDNIAYGALVVKKANKLEIRDSKFVGNKSQNGGAATIESVTDALIEDSTFETNVASARGGALYLHGDTVAELRNVEIDRCENLSKNAYFLGGGGVFVEGNARVLMQGGKITNCSAYGQGGGLMVLGKGSVTLEDNVEIANNSASAGGGIHADGELSDDQTLIIESAWIHHNEATASEGGGVFLNNNTPFRLDNAIIRGNSVKDSRGQGGGLWICPFGSFDGFAFSGMAVYNNSTDYGSSDVMVIPGHGTRYINISPYMLGGGEQNWMKEEAAEAVVGLPLHPAKDDYYQNRMLEKMKTIELKALPSKEDIAAAEKSAKIIIENNAAQAKGGGVALNGPTSSGYDKKITVHKTWAGDKNPKQPTSVSVQLYRNGAVFGNPVVLSESSSWTHSWDNIDANSTWTVGEVGKLPEGYLAPIYQGQGTEEITIINTFKDKVVEPVDPTMYKITKSWEGEENPDQPKSISVQRYKNGVPFGEPIQLEAGSNWAYSWEDTELTSKWTVKETSKLPEGYMKPVYIGQETQDIRIINTYKGAETPTETITRKVVKKWAGDTNPNQPDKVKVQLYKDGKPFGWAKTLNKSNKWTYTWEGLEKGYRWTVEEIEVAKGYKQSLKVKGNLTTIYNTYTKPTKPISPVKPSKPNSPGTGDNLQLGLYVVIVLGSIMTLIAIALRRKIK